MLIAVDRRGPLAAAALVALLSLRSLVPLPAVAQEPSSAASVVVTTEVLGAVVGDLVADAAEVTVLMPGGADPHAWEPSARDAEHLLGADLVVANGLDLEEGLLTVLDAARGDGVVVFEAAEHVTRRALADADADAGADDHDGAHDTDDPHFWTDPLAMREVVVALEPALGAVGIDVSDHVPALLGELDALDAEVRQTLSVIAEPDRKLVTGHRSLGYFADRYGFELVGTVIPGLSTGGEPSARELAQLISDIRAAGVPVVFTEVGTPDAVARAVADDSGARLVELSTSQLPEDGSYASFIGTLAETISTALAD